MTKKTNYIISSIVGGFIILFCIYKFVTTKSFDEKLWKDRKSTKKNEWTRSDRQKMIGDVLDLIKNKNRTQIIQMLGDGNKSMEFNETRNLLYLLGPEGGPFGIDSEWLLIYFDKNGNFESSHVQTD